MFTELVSKKQSTHGKLSTYLLSFLDSQEQSLRPCTDLLCCQWDKLELLFGSTLAKWVRVHPSWPHTRGRPDSSPARQGLHFRTSFLLSSGVIPLLSGMGLGSKRVKKTLDSKMKFGGPAWWYMLVIPALRRLRSVDRESSRTAWTT
jgi:hypothetical protein